MVAYNFQHGWRDQILSGGKTSTIRPPRRRGHARPGDRLQLYVGLRTRQAELLATTICAASMPVTVPDDVTAELAAREGFADTAALVAWFERRYGLPFNGVAIQWHAPGGAPGS